MAQRSRPFYALNLGALLLYAWPRIHAAQATSNDNEHLDKFFAAVRLL